MLTSTCNTDSSSLTPLNSSTAYCRSSNVCTSIQVHDNMHWSMQFTHIRSKLVFSFFCPFCLNHFPVHLQVRLSADVVLYFEGKVVLPRPAPPPSLLLPSFAPRRLSLSWPVLSPCQFCAADKLLPLLCPSYWWWRCGYNQLSKLTSLHQQEYSTEE